MFAVVSDWEALVPRSGDAGAVNDPAVLPGTPAEPLPSETPKRHELPLIEPVETALGSARSVRALWEEPDEPALILPCSAILEGPAIPQAMRERMEAMPAGADQATVIGHQLRTTEGGAVASGAGAGPAATKDVEPAPATGNSAKGQPATGGGGGGAPSARPTGRGNRPPAYPRVASERGWEGTTIVRAEVLADGTVGSAEVTSSSGHAVLDEAAASAVRQWRFSPALADGKPVRSQIEVPVVFQLEP
jgi:protein TonB